MKDKKGRDAQSIGQGLVDGRKLFDDLQDDARGFMGLALLLREIAGINLPETPKNRSLMASRLSSVLRDIGLDSYAEYAEFLRTSGSEAQQEFVSALTTNTTHFFREGQHYEILRKLVAELIDKKVKARSRELRIWCAAASTGQEPYTIAMVLRECLPDPAQWDVKFISTDIDPVPLGYAARGVYTENEAASIPPALRQKYFKPVQEEHGPAFQAVDTLRRMIRFAPLNLVQDKYPFQHRFDIVFCRNVLIYFEAKTANEVVHRLGECLAPGGYLFLGHSESGAMKTPLLTGAAPAVYRRAA